MVHVALIRLAAGKLFVPRWSEEVMDDLRELWRDECPDESVSTIDAQISWLRREFEDAMSVPREHVVVGPFPTEISTRARHVLEAVINGQAQTILTTRPDDYAVGFLKNWGVVVQDVDDFMCSQLQLHYRRVMATFDKWLLMNADRHAGPQSMGELVRILAQEIPNFAHNVMAMIDPADEEEL
jgi:hypothetical protein